LRRDDARGHNFDAPGCFNPAVPSEDCFVKTTRRTLLKAAAALPAALALPPIAAAPAAPTLVLHQGWVLRADDLARLGRA